MNIRYFVLFFLAMILAACSYGQGWERNFGDRVYQTGRTVFETDQGYIFVTGAEADPAQNNNVFPYVRLFTPSGDELWSINFPLGANSIPSFVHPAGDGAFVFYVNERYELDGEQYYKDVIHKINLAGEVIYSQDVEEEEKVSPLVGIIPEDNQLTYFYEKNSGFLQLVRLDNGGNEVLNILTEIPEEGTYSIFKVGDQYVIRNWIIDQAAETNSWILYRLNLNGDLVSTQSLPDLFDGDAGRFTLLENGDWVAVNHFPSPNNNGIKQTYVETATGATTIDTLWSPDQEFLTIFDVDEHEDGVTTLLHVPSTQSIKLIKSSFAGEIIWQRDYDHQPASVQPYRMEHTNDKGYLVIGEWQDNGIKNYLIRTDSTGQIYPNIITGKVAIDETENCLVDGQEPPLANWIIRAENEEEVFVGLTDISGNYSLPAAVNSYTLIISRPNDYWLVCDNDLTLEFSEIDTFANINFAVQPTIECPNLVISQTTPSIVSCNERPSYISYCNYGTTAAEDAYIEITYDSLIQPVSATLPYDELGGGIYRFSLGDVQSLECGEFIVNLFLDCEAEEGAAYCMEAHAYPDSLCSPVSSLWSGAFLEITSTCEEDSVKFNIENVGSGDMDDFSRYIIVEDVILQIVDSVDLDSGESKDVKFEGNGATFTMIAEQVPDAPGQTIPIGIVEGCGTNDDEEFSIGFSNQFPLNDADPYLDMDCPTAVSIPESNEINGYPLGYSEEHFIEPKTPIEYIIRFQNTGADTVVSVIIKDTLSRDFDISTFQAGASSHPYSYEMRGNQELVFNFRNIKLPSTITDEINSHGFVEFKISPKEDLSLGTIIENKAAIYFDFNEAIVTDKTTHTLASDFIEIIVGTNEVTRADYLAINIQPNPFKEETIIEIVDDIAQDFHFELYNTRGELIKSINQNSNKFILSRGNLSSGIYFYRIFTSSNKFNAGKLIVH